MRNSCPTGLFTMRLSTAMQASAGLTLILLVAVVAAEETDQTVWARRLGIDGSHTNSTGMTLVLIPPGTFEMGTATEEIDRLVRETNKAQRAAVYRSEGPRHRVEITQPYYLGETSVTIGQFRQFVVATGYKTVAERDGRGGFVMKGRKWVRDPQYIWSSGAGFEATDRHPVVNVSWNDCVEFCHWLSRQEGARYRLPTEAEWEYACRAGETGSWQSGASPEGMDRLAWHRGNSEWRIHPVATRSPNAWGLFDMQGNVRNWCHDWYAEDYYSRSPRRDPPGPDQGMSRIVRGSCFHYYPVFLRSATRFRDPPEHRHGQLGFRVVREIDIPTPLHRPPADQSR